MLVREIDIVLPDLRLAARAWGDPALPPLLALHGWLDNAASFDRLAPLLCEEFHIVALDLPGHGRSDWRAPGAWYHHVDYPGDVLAAADALGWRRFGLLGHSLGGGVATAVAAACPERISRLLLIEALGVIAGAPEKTLMHLQAALADRAGYRNKELRVFAHADMAVAARMQANGLSREAATLLVTRGLKAVPGGFSWSSDPRLTLNSAQRFGEDQVLAIVRGVRAPTLLVLAQPDAPFLPQETMARRIAQVADIHAVCLPGSHHLHLEDPQPVAVAIRDFIAAAAERQA
ncbi:MAG: alpha/beta fold hydrolase [Rudaea sp.]|nr:alpha/beta fold hydrolase [Rudaea sp.]